MEEKLISVQNEKEIWRTNPGNLTFKGEGFQKKKKKKPYKGKTIIEQLIKEHFLS